MYDLVQTLLWTSISFLASLKVPYLAPICLSFAPLTLFTLLSNTNPCTLCMLVTPNSILSSPLKIFIKPSNLFHRNLNMVCIYTPETQCLQDITYQVNAIMEKICLVFNEGVFASKFYFPIETYFRRCMEEIFMAVIDQMSVILYSIGKT